MNLAVLCASCHLKLHWREGPGISGAANSGVGWGKYEPAIRRWERVLEKARTRAD